ELPLFPRRAEGSSARAEIDPRPDRRHDHRHRLLRPRGDRPLIARELGLADKAPPPARRSTPGGRTTAPGWRGSSARAEIDPGAAVAATTTEGLLRPRGDRPAHRVRLLT